MKIHDVKQGELEWLALRAGIPTASEMDALITPLWKVKTGDGPRTYLFQKLAEWWQGGPLPSFQSFSMEQGSLLESEAIPWFEFEYNAAVRRVGFITTDDGLAGCSPDGLLSDDEGLELKCPQAETQVRYLCDGILPKAYEVQVHFSMFVTGAERWKFVSYRRGFPCLVLTVERDEDKQAVIVEALESFRESFDAYKTVLIAANGGREPRRIVQPECPAEKLMTQMAKDARRPLYELEIVP